MKKTAVIIAILLVVLTALATFSGLFSTAGFSQLGLFTKETILRYMNWYETQTQDEIEDANKFAKERLEKKYHIFVNDIFVDIGYEWDRSLFVPIRTICESLNWTVNWLPELGVIQLVKDKDEAYVNIVNFFGKAFVELSNLENLLRLQEVTIHGGNITIYDHCNPGTLNSLSLKELKQFCFYIDGMKMTDKAIEYQGQKYLPVPTFAQSFGRLFRYDAVKGHAYIDNKRVASIFVDGEAYSSLDSLQAVVNTGECVFDYRTAANNDSVPTPVIIKGAGKKMAALTFDDYLGDKVYPLLDVLRQNEVKATFFIIGNSIANNSGLLKTIVQEGHEIANHTWDHFNLFSLRVDEIRAQLISAQLMLKQFGGTAASCFRPPGGYYDNNIVRIAQEAGLRTVLWSLNSTDADGQNGPLDIKNTIVRQIHPGAIIVMHMDRESTIAALTGTINQLRNKGYHFVTVSQLISDRERR